MLFLQAKEDRESPIKPKDRAPLKEIGELCDEFTLKTGFFFFNRDPASFGSIINYYRTGALHLPTGVCVREFQEELIYWGLNPVNQIVYDQILLFSKI